MFIKKIVSKPYYYINRYCCLSTGSVIPIFIIIIIIITIKTIILIII